MFKSIAVCSEQTLPAYSSEEHNKFRRQMTLKRKREMCIRDRDDIGREGFLKRAWEWKERFGGRIIEQLKLLGSSCDWDRLRFTMDEGCSQAVRHVFVKLYEKGLIYRGCLLYTSAAATPPASTSSEIRRGFSV